MPCRTLPGGAAGRADRPGRRCHADRRLRARFTGAHVRRGRTGPCLSHHDRAGRHAAAGRSGSRAGGGLSVRAGPGRARLMPDRRQHRHQCGRQPRDPLRHGARPGAGTGSRAARRNRAVHDEQDGQEQCRPRSEASVHRHRGHAGHHHAGRAPPASGRLGRQYRVGSRARFRLGHQAAAPCAAPPGRPGQRIRDDVAGLLCRGHNRRRHRRAAAGHVSTIRAAGPAGGRTRRGCGALRGDVGTRAGRRLDRRRRRGPISHADPSLLGTARCHLRDAAHLRAHHQLRRVRAHLGHRGMRGPDARGAGARFPRRSGDLLRPRRRRQRAYRGGFAAD